MKRQGKTPRESPYTPNKFDVHEKIVKGKEPLFKDESDNLYGFLPKNHRLYKNQKEAGLVDDDGEFMMWIALPRLERRSPSTYSSFPLLHSTVTLYKVFDDSLVGTFRVESFPEKIKRNSRSSSIVLSRQ